VTSHPTANLRTPGPLVIGTSNLTNDIVRREEELLEMYPSVIDRLEDR
jgi:hypothetical protein